MELKRERERGRERNRRTMRSYFTNLISTRIIYIYIEREREREVKLLQFIVEGLN